MRQPMDSLLTLIDRWHALDVEGAPAEQLAAARHALELRLSALDGYAKGAGSGALLDYLNGVTVEEAGRSNRAQGLSAATLAAIL